MMALSDPPPSVETQMSAPAPGRTALPSRPLSRETSNMPQSKSEPSLIEDYEQARSEVGPSPTLTRASVVSSGPPSPVQSKAGSPSAQAKKESSSSQEYTGQVCRCVTAMLMFNIQHDDSDLDSDLHLVTVAQLALRCGGDPHRAQIFAMLADCI